MQWLTSRSVHVCIRIHGDEIGSTRLWGCGKLFRPQVQRLGYDGGGQNISHRSVEREIVKLVRGHQVLFQRLGDGDGWNGCCRSRILRAHWVWVWRLGGEICCRCAEKIIKLVGHPMWLGDNIGGQCMNICHRSEQGGVIALAGHSRQYSHLCIMVKMQLGGNRGGQWLWQYTGNICHRSAGGEIIKLARYGHHRIMAKV